MPDHRVMLVPMVAVIDVEAFRSEGYAVVRRAGGRECADAARAMLWRQVGLSPDDAAGWSQPVRWASDLTGAGPFGDLVRSPRLAASLDQICGPGRWLPLGALGNVPVRFPVAPPNEDRGWHVDANTLRADGTWAVSGRPRTILLLTLLSEVGPDDAPTRIRAGSHLDVAEVLSADALTPFEAGPMVEAASTGRPVVHATGEPGDMYVVHPFTVHAADEHRGRTPRFMAQTPVQLARPLEPGDPSPLGCVFARR